MLPGGARAANRLFLLGMDIEQEMDLAYRGELFTGSRCGRMDQARAFGSVPVFLVFNGPRMTIETLRARLHGLLSHPAVARLGLGAKGVGSQGDGCAQVVCPDEESRRCLSEILERDLGVRCLEHEQVNVPGGDMQKGNQHVQKQALC